MLKPSFEQIVSEVRALKAADRYPFLPVVEAVGAHRSQLADAGNVCMFASCDYLGLSQDPTVKEGSIAAIEKFGTNTFGAQIYSGHTTLHHALEARLSAFTSKPAALLFPSGMHANLGVITSLMGPNDVVINDRLNHTSLLMATNLSGAQQRNYRHVDMAHLEEILIDSAACGKRLIVTDGVFSADGDLAPMVDICRLAKRHDAAVMVDEAHSFGLFGATGCGVAEHFGCLDEVDFLIGTMSKAFGSVGGFVAASEDVVTFLRHVAPSYTSSRGSPPAVVGASLAALDRYASDGRALREAAIGNTEHVLTRLRAAGLNCLNAASPSIPVHIGDRDKTITISRWLLDQGILVSAMLPPTVPPGGARLRLGITALHTRAELDRLIDLLIAAKHEFRF